MRFCKTYNIQEEFIKPKKSYYGHKQRTLGLKQRMKNEMIHSHFLMPVGKLLLPYQFQNPLYASH